MATSVQDPKMTTINSGDANRGETPNKIPAWRFKSKHASILFFENSELNVTPYVIYILRRVHL